uniref:ATP synthase subunit a n=1 Tax=Rhinoderma darwinii TaxID=43563 RepID=S4V058_9NEOB|nr:ATP synthase F0 subunit 6 [Rhinoderma darwinii]
MTLNLFNQFASPTLMGLPLVFIALLMPWLLTPTPCKRWMPNRIMTLQSWFTKTFSKQIFSPLSNSGHKWALLLASLMIFLLGMNMLGLLPYTFTPTTQLSLNLGLAIPLWLATIAIGFRNQFTMSIGHFLPEGTPTPLIPILIIIETISLFIRPLALGVRLTANLTAGHLLIQLISTATMALLFTSPLVSTLTFLTLLLLTALEIAVAMIQAYVFVLLLSLYLQENTYGTPSSCFPHSRP